MIRTENMTDLFFVQFSERYPAWHEDGGSLGDPEHLPAEALEEGGEVRLAGGLAAARPPGQHQLVDAASGGHGVFDF